MHDDLYYWAIILLCLIAGLSVVHLALTIYWLKCDMKKLEANHE